MSLVNVKTTIVFNHLPKIAAQLRPRAGAIVRKAAFDIEAGAKVRAPVLTGILRASIQTVMVTPLHYRVSVGADYGIYQEYGTVHMAAHPFLGPAINQVAPVFVMAMRKVAG